MKHLLIFPGRFQVPGKHHIQVFERIMKTGRFDGGVFATSNVSNNTDSPLKFSQKKQIFKILGYKNVVMVQSPYKIAEYRGIFGEDVEFTFLIGEKDGMRLQKSKMFSKYPEESPEGGASLIIADNIVDKGTPVSASSFRLAFRDGVADFQEYFGAISKGQEAAIRKILNPLITESTNTFAATSDMPDSGFLRPGKKLRLKYASWMRGMVQLDFPVADNPFDAETQYRSRDEVIINPTDPNSKTK